jgi:Tol biopolymer transport system component
MFRRIVVPALVLLASAIAAACASGSVVGATSVSPCSRVSQPTWSPDGTRIAYYGTRWPPPTHRHRNPNDILQALCSANADGTNVKPLRYTVCSERCPDPPYPIVWLQSGIIYLRDGDIFRIVPGSKPQKIARPSAVDFVTNPAGTRVATDLFYPGCLSCAGPVTILDARSGAVVGTAGGKKLENINPSLSPDGSQVGFERDASNNSGKAFGIWTANTDGTHLRQLVKVGQRPLWSPTAAKIGYIAPAGKSVALRLVSAGGGKSRALVRNVSLVFGWSPDGKSLAFETDKGKLAIVDVATGKVRTLLKLYYSPSAVWSPDSSQLLANTVTKINSVTKSPKCWSTWRVPADGTKPTRISTCS